MAASAALLAGCGGGGLAGPESSRETSDYEALIALYPVESPGFGRETYTDQLVEEPMTVALVLRAESIRFGATASGEACARARAAVDWLLARSDADGDGRPGWGTAGSWDAFSDGSVNPPSTVYTITTAVAIDALSAAAATPGLLAPERGAAAARAAAEAARWALDAVWRQGYFQYSSAPHDDVDVPNVNAFMAGAMAAARARIPEAFDAELASRVDAAVPQAAEGVSRQGKAQGGIPYWAYVAKPNRFGNRDSWNDLLHHAYVLYGLELVRRYRPDVPLDYTVAAARASLASFWRAGRAMDFPQGVAYEEGLRDLEALPARSWGVGLAIAVACMTGDRPAARAFASCLRTDYLAFPSFAEYPAWFGSQNPTFYPRYGAHALLGLACLTYRVR